MKRIVAVIVLLVVVVLLAGAAFYACRTSSTSPLDRLLASGMLDTKPRRGPDGTEPPPPDQKLPIEILESYYAADVRFSEGFRSYHRFTCPGYEETELSRHPVADVNPEDPYLHNSFFCPLVKARADLRAFLRERVRLCARYYLVESGGMFCVVYVEEKKGVKQYHSVNAVIWE